MASRRRRRPLLVWAAHVALVPMALTTLLVYVWTVAWSVRISLSTSKMVPRLDWAGIAQYQRLFSTARWTVSIQHAAVFGVLFIAAALLVGFLLAVFIDQRVQGEDLLRTVFLYPLAVSLIVTGLVWRWMFNPSLGIENFLHEIGFKHAAFNWLAEPQTAMFGIILASIWQSSGFYMALMLAGLK